MGFKDYIDRIPPVTKNLLIINIIVWIAMALLPAAARFIERWCALYYFTSDQFVPSQLFTYMFVHANFTHLFFNMWALFMFGVTMERVLGPTKFLFYYMSCGIGAALIQEGVFALMINHYAGLFENGSALCELLRHSRVTNFEVSRLGISAIEHFRSLPHSDGRRIRRHIRHPVSIRIHVPEPPHLHDYSPYAYQGPHLCNNIRSHRAGSGHLSQSGRYGGSLRASRRNGGRIAHPTLLEKEGDNRRSILLILSYDGYQASDIAQFGCLRGT